MFLLLLVFVLLVLFCVLLGFFFLYRRHRYVFNTCIVSSTFYSYLVYNVDFAMLNDIKSTVCQHRTHGTVYIIYIDSVSISYPRYCLKVCQHRVHDIVWQCVGIVPTILFDSVNIVSTILFDSMSTSYTRYCLHHSHRIYMMTTLSLLSFVTWQHSPFYLLSHVTYMYIC